MDLQKIETSSQQVDEIVKSIIGDKTVELDNYMNGYEKYYGANIRCIKD